MSNHSLILTTMYCMESLDEDGGGRSLTLTNAIKAGADLITHGSYPPDSFSEVIGLPTPPSNASHVELRAPVCPGGGWEVGRRDTAWYDQHLVVLRVVLPDDDLSSSV